MSNVYDYVFPVSADTSTTATTTTKRRGRNPSPLPPRIGCAHKKEDHVIAENSEVVCKRCGVVLGVDNSQEISTASVLNLFHEVMPGTKPVQTEFARRAHQHKSDASYFSNACDKLRLPRHCYLEAWNTYSKLRQGTSYSKAKIASFALFTACKRYSIPRSEKEIQDAIIMTFRAKRIPTMLKVFSQIKIEAQNLGIICNNNNNNDDDGDNNFTPTQTNHVANRSQEYYLNLYLAKEQQRLGSEIDFGLVRRKARSIFGAMKGNDDTKARKAVQIVLGGRRIRRIRVE